MQSGDLRDRITILKQSQTTDTQGGRSVSWVDLISGTTTNLKKWWARVEIASVAEGLAPNTAITAVQRYRVTLRYQARITALMRVTWTPYRASAAKTLEIHGVKLLPDRDLIELDCAEVV